MSQVSEVKKQKPGQEGSWVNYSELDRGKYTSILTLFSLSSSLVLQPFSVVMTRQQAGPLLTGDKQHNSLMSNMVYTYQKLGMKGLFRGWLPMALAGSPAQVLYLEITESSREYFQAVLRRAFPGVSNTVSDAMQASMSSVLANGASLIPYVPGEVLSSRMIVQGRSGLGMVDMSRAIWKESGILGFYRGFNASLMLGISYSTAWWWSYSTMRRDLSKLETFRHNPIAMDAVAGLVAGSLTTTVIHPLDTVKTIIMTGSSDAGKPAASVYRTFANVVRYEGVRSLFRGLRASLLQTALSSTVFAVSYELIKRVSMSDSSD
jgi:hypothetical protein